MELPAEARTPIQDREKITVLCLVESSMAWSVIGRLLQLAYFEWRGSDGYITARSFYGVPATVKAEL